MIIRPKSALGLKYVEITRGTSRDGYADGDTIPVSASKPTEVEFDEFVNMFDDETRASMQKNLRGFGDALAGRGDDINIALGVFPALLRDIIPVAQNLSSPSTHLKRFFSRSAMPRARSRPPPRPRPPCSSTWTRRSPRCARSRGRSSRTRSSRAARRSTPPSAPSPCSGRSCATPRACSRAAARRARAAHRRPQPRLRLRHRPAHVQALAAVQPAPGLAAHRAADLRQRPSGPARPQAAGGDAQRCSTPRCRTSRPRRRPATT